MHSMHVRPWLGLEIAAGEHAFQAQGRQKRCYIHIDAVYDSAGYMVVHCVLI